MFLRKSGCDFFSEADKNLDPDPAPDPAFCGQIRCKSFFSFFRFYIRQWITSVLKKSTVCLNTFAATSYWLYWSCANNLCKKAKCFGPESGSGQLTLQAHSGFNSEVLFRLPVFRIRICKFRKKTSEEKSRIEIRIHNPLVRIRGSWSVSKTSRIRNIASYLVVDGITKLVTPFISAIRELPKQNILKLNFSNGTI